MLDFLRDSNWEGYSKKELIIDNCKNVKSRLKKFPILLNSFFH
jgi:hypothetical protein